MMKNIKLILLFVILGFISFDNVYADTCSNKELEKLQSLASKVRVEFNVIQYENPSFEMIVYNLNENIRVEDFTTFEIMDDSNEKIHRYNVFHDNMKYQFKIYASNKTKCKNKLLSEKEIFIPKKNYYYKDPLCNDVKEFYLCQFWYPLEITHNSFEKKIIEYKNRKEKTKEDIIITKEKSFYEIAKEFIYNNYICLLIGFIIVLMLVILIINKRQKKEDIV